MAMVLPWTAAGTSVTPYGLPPQAVIRPSEVSARLCCEPPAMAVTPVSSRGTVAWRLMYSPQAVTLPSEVSAMLSRPPAAIAITVLPVREGSAVAAEPWPHPVTEPPVPDGGTPTGAAPAGPAAARTSTAAGTAISPARRSIDDASVIQSSLCGRARGAGWREGLVRGWPPNREIYPDVCVSKRPDSQDPHRTESTLHGTRSTIIEGR